jgi:prepilin-type N-terminal cleavage/methylation domain-containing protein
MMDRDGFSLVEVLVALVVLEVGLLGAVGMTLQAQRTLRVIVAHEAASLAVETVADSLALAGWAGAGHRITDEGELRWSIGGSGVVTVSFEGRQDLRLQVGFAVGGIRAP